MKISVDSIRKLEKVMVGSHFEQYRDSKYYYLYDVEKGIIYVEKEREDGGFTNVRTVKV